MINFSKFLPFFIPNVYRACSYFTNLDLFCIDNARVIYRKIRYIFWVCFCSLSYPERNAHGPYCHLWPFRSCSIFHIISQKYDFRNKTITKHKIRVVIFTTAFHIFFNLKRNKWDIIKNVRWSSYKVCLTLSVQADSPSEASITIYQSTRPKISEDLNMQQIPLRVIRFWKFYEGIKLFSCYWKWQIYKRFYSENLKSRENFET